MFKKVILLSLAGVSQVTFASNAIDLYHAPFASLNKFSIVQKNSKNELVATKTGSKDNQLLEVNQTRFGSKTIVRYQQTYKEIPVIGAQAVKDQRVLVWKRWIACP